MNFDRSRVLSVVESDLSRLGVSLHRGLKISVPDLIAFAAEFGEPEEAWEDAHPESKLMQLLSAETKVPISGKSSSQYWHADRSFTSKPSEITFLYCTKALDSTTRTQFLSSVSLLEALTHEQRDAAEAASAVHDYMKHLGPIFRMKGRSPEEISLQSAMYPPASHDLVSLLKSGKKALYYSELNTTTISCAPSVLSVEHLDGVLDAAQPVLDHYWTTGDLLVWDNRAVVHRGWGVETGIRALNRVSVS